jgi:hypothetical protein
MPDFDDQERDYKLRVADLVRDASDALQQGGDWVEPLGRAFKNNEQNLVSHWAFVPFLEWVEADREEAEPSLRALWEPGLDVGSRLDGFARSMPSGVVSGAGSRCNVGSFLLGAEDPNGWPVYRVTAFELALELTRSRTTEREASLGERYVHALGFLDEIGDRAAAGGTLVRDRLDSQSFVWCVTSWQKRPDSFTVDEWQELLLFRSIPSRLRTASKLAKLRKATKVKARPRPVCPRCVLDDEVRLIGPLDGDRWEFVCEAGPEHGDPYRFTARGT